MKPEPLTKDKIKSIAKHTDIDETTVIQLKDVKSACEFYLKYKDNLVLFSEDYTNEWKQFMAMTTPPFDFIAEEFNIWLFKFAFKGVL